MALSCRDQINKVGFQLKKVSGHKIIRKTKKRHRVQLSHMFMQIRRANVEVCD